MAVLGLGLVTAAGNSPELFLRAVPKIVVEPFATPKGLVKLATYRAGHEGLEEFVPARAARRLDGFARRTLLAALLALKDAGDAALDKERTGVVFGSSHGPVGSSMEFLDSVLDNGDAFASPTPFAASVHNSVAALVSIQAGLRGPSLSLSSLGMTTANALDAAALVLAGSEADHVLVGLGEDYHPLLGYAVACLGVGAERLAPLDFGLDGFCPGEGAVFFLLGRAGGRGWVELQQRVGLDEALDLLRGADRLFLGARGLRSESGAYRRLLARLPGAVRVECHAGAYGSMLSGAAFELAAAALSGGAACLEAAPDGRYNVYLVSSPATPDSR